MACNDGRQLTMTFIGDSYIGEKSLLCQATALFQALPHVTQRTIDGQDWEILLLDMMGYSGYSPEFAYNVADIILYCFDVTIPESLDVICNKFSQQVSNCKLRTPRMLIGFQDDQSVPCIPFEHISSAVDQLHCSGYLNMIPTEERLAELLDELVSPLVSECKSSVNGRKPGNQVTKLMLGVQVEASTFKEDLSKLLLDPSYADTTIRLGNDCTEVKAHKILLMSSSKTFRHAFHSSKTKKRQPLNSICCFRAFSKSMHVIAGKDQSNIYLPETTDLTVFHKLMMFLYTGSIDSLHEDSTSTTKDKESNSNLIATLRCFAVRYKLTKLKLYCDNMKMSRPPNDALTSQCYCIEKRLNFFLDNKQYADVKYTFRDGVVYANRCILSSRCEVLAAGLRFHHFTTPAKALSSQWQEVDMSSDELMGRDLFLLVLEYLYTDQVPLNADNVIAVLLAADRFCLTRLRTLCEDFLVKSILTGSVSVKDLVLISQISQMCCATQLSQRSLQYLAVNRYKFSQSEQWKELTVDNLSYINDILPTCPHLYQSVT